MNKFHLILIGMLGFGVCTLSPSLVSAENSQAESSYKITINSNEVEGTLFAVSLQQVNDHLAQGNFKELKQLLEFSISTYDSDQEQSTFGKYLSDAHTLLGNVNTTLGLYSEAEQALQKAIQIKEEQLDEGPNEITAPQLSLANIYFLTNRFDQAESLYKKVLAAYEKDLGLDHTDVAIVVHMLAHTNINRGQYDKAKPLLERAIAIREKQLGTKNPQTLDTRKDLETLQHMSH